MKADWFRQTSKVVDGVETVLHTYTYGDSDWKDLLTEFDGHKISYDAIGNPRSYHNGSVWWSMSWEQGRQLAYAFSDTIFIDYTYDMAGIRDSKDVAGTVYNYRTLGGKVMRQTWTKNGVDHVIDFAYDNAGSPYAFTYDGTTYYYVLNQQGDVIRIVNANGAAVAEYQYNAWGKLMTSEAELTAIGKVNPLRYRGYYYDAETGFYYLQSRYYDPSIGRFINADSFASTGQGFLGYNMFAYCGNNPTNNIDPTGHAFWGTNTVAICDGGSGSTLSHGLNQARAIGYGSDIYADRISIDLDQHNSMINYLSDTYGLSLQVICSEIAEGACDRYYQLFGYEFLLSDACVSNEIYEHVVAYQWSIGQRLVPNILGAGYAVMTGLSRDRVYEATRSTDIRLKDVCASTDAYGQYSDIFSQAVIFGYRQGIREIYVGNPAVDPWASQR